MQVESCTSASERTNEVELNCSDGVADSEYTPTPKDEAVNDIPTIENLQVTFDQADSPTSDKEISISDESSGVINDSVLVVEVKGPSSPFSTGQENLDSGRKVKFVEDDFSVNEDISASQSNFSANERTVTLGSYSKKENEAKFQPPAPLTVVTSGQRVIDRRKFGRYEMPHYFKVSHDALCCEKYTVKFMLGL